MVEIDLIWIAYACSSVCVWYNRINRIYTVIMLVCIIVKLSKLLCIHILWTQIHPFIWHNAVTPSTRIGSNFNVFSHYFPLVKIWSRTQKHIHSAHFDAMHSIKLWTSWDSNMWHEMKELWLHRSFYSFCQSQKMSRSIFHAHYIKCVRVHSLPIFWCGSKLICHAILPRGETILRSSTTTH